MKRRSFRDTTRSEKIEALNSPVTAETLFYRIMMRADCYGNFYGTPALVRAECYPLRDNVRTADIARFLKELSGEASPVEPSGQTSIGTGLIRMYEVSGKPYLHILNFGQTHTYKEKKFPDPPEVEVEGEVEIEEEVEVKREKCAREARSVELIFPFDSEKFLAAWNLLLSQKKWKKKTAAALQMSLKLLSKYSEDDAIEMMERAIAGEWQGLHELKNNNGKSTYKVNGQINRGAHSDAELAAGMEEHYRKKQQGGTV